MEQGLFQFSIDNTSEIVLIFDDTGRIIYANQSAVQQLEYDQVLACYVTDIFPKEVQTEYDLKEVAADRKGEARQMLLYRGNRTCFPAQVKFLPYEEEGKCLYVCMAKNISNEYFLEKKASKADQDAEEAHKVKTEFVANVTHELRTPVNGILGNTRELLEMETDKDKLRLLQLVERGCRDMNAIINNILDFSKLEAGKFVLEPRSFQFRNMMEYVQANHRKRITEKGLEFSMIISKEIPEHVIGDELRIVQILNNLISNAYKFTSVGEIHVEVVKTAQTDNRMELFFMVVDSGIGIAKHDQEKLFKSFSQVDASISRKYGGTGLGLNICKQLVELMNGNIFVQSEVGKGTIFSFDIWVEVPEEERDGSGDSSEAAFAGNALEQTLIQKLTSLSETTATDKIWRFGERENKEEIKKKLSKLVLSIEMENWEKAESFAETVKQLVEEAPREIKSAALRLKMSVQKGDYEKAAAAAEVLQQAVEEAHGRG